MHYYDCKECAIHDYESSPEGRYSQYMLFVAILSDHNLISLCGFKDEKQIRNQCFLE